MRAVGPRVATAFLLITFLPGGVPHPAIAQSQTDQAAAVLTGAREALGGNERLTAVKTFTATGRTRQVRGDNLVPIEFQMSWESPDKYVRRDEFPAQDSGPATSGFNGNALIQAPALAIPAGPARGGGPPPLPAAEVEANRVATLKQDLARLMLGMFAGSVSIMPLTFTYVGVAEAPQGQADVLEAKGPASFVARFFVDKTTRLPVMVSWQAPNAPPGLPPRAGGPARGAGGPARGADVPARGSATPQTTVEHRLYFGEYRDVAGLKWPFRIRRALGAEPVEETNFDGFRINVKVDPRRFEVRP